MKNYNYNELTGIIMLATGVLAITIGLAWWTWEVLHPGVSIAIAGVVLLMGGKVIIE